MAAHNHDRADVYLLATQERVVYNLFEYWWVRFLETRWKCVEL